MRAVASIALWIGLQVMCTAGVRGPHHPKSTVSHHHCRPRGDVKLTEDSELLHDTTHLKEDIGPLADQLDFSKMTEQEIEFHYFRAHDIDNNTKLDGLELFLAIQHSYHEDGDYEEDAGKGDDWVAGLVDYVLEHDDANNNGYLEYVEYVMSRQRNHIAQEKRERLRIGS